MKLSVNLPYFFDDLKTEERLTTVPWIFRTTLLIFLSISGERGDKKNTETFRG